MTRFKIDWEKTTEAPAPQISEMVSDTHDTQSQMSVIIILFKLFVIWFITLNKFNLPLLLFQPASSSQEEALVQMPPVEMSMDAHAMAF